MKVLIWIGGIIAVLWLYAKVRRWWKYSPALMRIRWRKEILSELQSSDPEARKRGAKRLENRRDLPKLLRIARKDVVPYVRVAAYARLRTWGDVTTTCDLINEFKTGNQAVQITEILSEWLGENGDSGTIFNRGIHALIQIGGEEAFKGLVTFYGNANLPERLAKDMLTEFRRKPQITVTKVIELLSADPDRTPLIGLLGALKQGQAVPFLRQSLESAKYSYVVDEILKSLVQIGGAEAVAAVTTVLSHEQPGVRRTACECLGQLGNDAAPLLKKMLSDKDETVRISAVRALAQYGQSSITPLSDLLARDTSTQVKFEIAVILCQSGQEFAKDRVFSEVVSQAALESETCSQSAIGQACAYLRCSEDYALARLTLHIPTTSRVCGRSSSGGGDYYADELNPDASLKALRELCLSKSEFATEILKMVAGRQSVTVSLSSCNYSTDRTVDLARWQQEARQELIRRGIQA